VRIAEPGADIGALREPKAAALLADTASGELLQALYADLEQLSGPDYDESLSRIVKALNRPAGKVFKLLRAAITGRLWGPHLSDLLALLGPEEVRSRIERELQ